MSAEHALKDTGQAWRRCPPPFRSHKAPVHHCSGTTAPSG
ncbi:unnamed protein product [Choristocarpus tenellus]